jgi:tetratricopeptide (TPR) repeat protein
MAMHAAKVETGPAQKTRVIFAFLLLGILGMPERSFGHDSCPVGDAKPAPAQDKDAGAAKSAPALKFYEEALDAYSKAQYNVAVELCDKVISHDGRYINALVLKGLAYYGQGKLEEATKEFERAISIDAKKGLAYSCRAKVYIAKGMLKEAIADYSTAIRLEPKGDDYMRRAELYYATEQYEQCLRDYEGANLLKGDIESLICYANVLSSCPSAKVRNGKKALKTASDLCKITEFKNSEALDALATAYAENGQFDEAVKYEKKATSLNSRPLFAHKLELFEQGKPYRTAPYPKLITEPLDKQEKK